MFAREKEGGGSYRRSIVCERKETLTLLSFHSESVTLSLSPSPSILRFISPHPERAGNDGPAESDLNPELAWDWWNGTTKDENGSVAIVCDRLGQKSGVYRLDVFCVPF